MVSSRSGYVTSGILNMRTEKEQIPIAVKPRRWQYRPHSTRRDRADGAIALPIADGDFFAAAKVIHPASAAPKDGTPIIARDDAGEVALVRWRTGADLEPGDQPYWARFDTDEEFEFIEWTPSPFSAGQILEFYG